MLTLNGKEMTSTALNKVTFLKAQQNLITKPLQQKV